MNLKFKVEGGRSVFLWIQFGISIDIKCEDFLWEEFSEVVLLSFLVLFL